MTSLLAAREKELDINALLGCPIDDAIPMLAQLNDVVGEVMTETGNENTLGKVG
jgi:hypothetical protein